MNHDHLRVAEGRHWVHPEVDVEASTSEARERLRAALDAAVADHLESDAPLGVFLSSGVDSTVVASRAAAAREAVRTFTVGFDDAPELTPAASKAIDKGLAYLLTVQKKDGSWDSNGEGGYSVAITSLALMAFMANAHFPGFGPHAKPLDRGMKWLLKEARKRPDGYLGTVMYEHGLATLAFPAISCGVYGYPHADAAAIAVAEVRAGLARHDGIESVVFACFDRAMRAHYDALLAPQA